MNTIYKKVAFAVPDDASELLIALLADLGFEGFEEKPASVDAYIVQTDFDEAELRARIDMIPAAKISYEVSDMPRQNWNKKWEENYPSVFIDDFCQIIPSYRQAESGYAHSLIIDPKMSFGTGNHATTRSMIRLMKTIDFSGNMSWMWGVGTGVLGILASKLGAVEVLGIDIDEWSEENAGENIRLNHVQNMVVKRGDASTIPSLQFDCVLANINRNVLLQDMHIYAQHLKLTGQILLSGFYTWDVEKILDVAQRSGLQAGLYVTENDWVAYSFSLK